MKEIKLKTRIMSMSQNDATEKVTNGDNYISVKISNIVEKFNESGELVKTNFLNFKLMSLLESFAVLNKDCKKALMLCDENTALKVAELVCCGNNLVITRSIYEQGEKSPVQGIELDKHIIINTLNVDDNELILSDEDFADEISELIAEGKAIRKQQDADRAAVKKAAKEALLAKLALAVEPEPEQKQEIVTE